MCSCPWRVALTLVAWQPVPLDQRPEFVVPRGKRRLRQAPGRTERAERTERTKPSTYRGSPTTKAALARQGWKGRTTSPTGRGHPDRDRRNDVRKADLHADIDYFATQRDPSGVTGSTGDPVFTAPNNDQKNKEASWLASQVRGMIQRAPICSVPDVPVAAKATTRYVRACIQAWFESLRHYPRGATAVDSEAAYSGLTHGKDVPSTALHQTPSAPPTLIVTIRCMPSALVEPHPTPSPVLSGTVPTAEHLETDVRTRLGLAEGDPDWKPWQLQEAVCTPQRSPSPSRHSHCIPPTLDRALHPRPRPLWAHHSQTPTQTRASHPWQWAPENPKMAQRVMELRAKLRGTTIDDPSIAAAGDPNGPDLWA